MEILSVGSLAYYDSFLGMIPCKVTAINGQTITAIITAKKSRSSETLGDSRIYKHGEVIISMSRIVPRKSVKFRKHGTYIQQFKIKGYDAL